MTKRKLLVWIPVAAIFLNGLAYVIVSNLRTPSRSGPAGPIARLPGGPPPQGPSEDRKREADKAREDKEADEQAERDKEAKALARRSAGLAALDAGEYEKALIDFTEARALLGDKANVSELLRVTEDLRNRPRGTPRVRPGGPASSGVPRSTARLSGPRRVATREEPVVESAQAPAAPPSGLIIVTTTPRGLLVQVDETAVDITPMRTKVKPGSHHIALLDGDRKVYETTVDVKEGGTTTLLKDLPMPLEGVAEPSRATPPAGAAPVASEESVRPVLPVAAAPTPPRPAPRLAAPPPGATTDTGALDISSPGLYGVVWINGRPRGYPPLEVRDLPVGPAKVEVRVNGIEKRSSMVVVQAGLTTPVKLRSQEAVH